MPPEPVSPDDPRLNFYQCVRDPELARRFQLFVAEGRLVVTRAIQRRPGDILSVLVSHTALHALSGVLAALPVSVPIFTAGVEQLRAISGFAMHHGCLALVRRREPPPAEAIISAAKTLVVLEDVANPDNVGGVFRLGQALGADALLLSDSCADPLYRKSVRTSMGAALDLPYGRFSAWGEVRDVLRTHGFVTVALTPSPDADALPRVPARVRDGRLALLVGGEGEGLRPETLDGADIRARIPMIAGADSLNLAVATAVALSQLRPLA
jgi:tRNA G18 (ribose-2'-O)-methylase SpoU